MYGEEIQDVVGQQRSTPTSAAADATHVAPAGVRGFWISVATQDAIVSLDGSVASATNGLRIKVGAPAQFFPISKSLSVIGTNVAASEVNVVWVR